MNITYLHRWITRDRDQKGRTKRNEWKNWNCRGCIWITHSDSFLWHGELSWSTEFSSAFLFLSLASVFILDHQETIIFLSLSLLHSILFFFIILVCLSLSDAAWNQTTCCISNFFSDVAAIGECFSSDASLKVIA